MTKPLDQNLVRALLRTVYRFDHSTRLVTNSLALSPPWLAGYSEEATDACLDRLIACRFIAETHLIRMRTIPIPAPWNRLTRRQPSRTRCSMTGSGMHRAIVCLQRSHKSKPMNRDLSIGLKATTVLYLFVATGCASSQMSVATSPGTPTPTVSRLAIAPGSGVFGDAVGIELFNSGVTVVDANDAVVIAGRSGLQEHELTSSKGFAALRESGIDAVLSAKSVAAADGTPESASVRIMSTQTGEIIAGITWQNGSAGQRGSIADRTVRKNLSAAARDIAAEIMKRIRVQK